MLQLTFAVILTIHSLIHLIGFVKAFGYAKIEQITKPISRFMGLVWLLATSIFLTATICFMLNKDWWWIIAVPAILISQFLIITHWKNAKFGTLVNALALLVAIICFGTWSFNRMTKIETTRLIEANATITQKPPNRDAKFNAAPDVVKKWLEKSGALTYGPIRTVHLIQDGEMRTKQDGEWMLFSANQIFSVGKPGFIWKVDVEAMPFIHLTGRDFLENGKGQMLIKLLSIYPIVDAHGAEIDQGTMVRYLAETIWFPSAALNEYMTWENIDKNSARATMAYEGITVSGIFNFNDNGDVVGFSAKRYYDRPTGATLEDWRIEIDPNSYQEFDGLKIPTASTVSWDLKDGTFNWLKLRIKNAEYGRK